jgi:hypothetical protein
VRRNREKLLRLSLAVAIVFCVVIFIFIRGRTGIRWSYTAPEPNYNLPTGRMEWEPLPSAPQTGVRSEPTPNEANTPAVIASAMLTPAPARSLLFVRKIPLLTMQIAVVDSERLLALHPPIDESREARQKAIDDIQRATAICAAAHNCEIVLSNSSQTLNSIPIVVYSDEQLDLTGEVIQRLQH